MKKTYEEFGALHMVDELICEDVKHLGFSQGWTGDVETFKMLKQRMAKKNIEYGFLGTWKPKKNNEK